MGAGLESHVHVSAASRLARSSQCDHFGVGLAGACVETLADNRTVADDDAADKRIGRSGTASLLGEECGACEERVSDPGCDVRE